MKRLFLIIGLVLVFSFAYADTIVLNTTNIDTYIKNYNDTDIYIIDNLDTPPIEKLYDFIIMKSAYISSDTTYGNFDPATVKEIIYSDTNCLFSIKVKYEWYPKNHNISLYLKEE